jgi:lysophospholipase L1-like esterase
MIHNARTKKIINIPLGLMLSSFSLMLTVLLLELVFRIVDIKGDYLSPRQDLMVAPTTAPPLPYSFYPHGIIRSVYPSNPRGYFDENNAIDHVHNSAGWRDAEHSLVKPPATYRILGLGDSYLYGQGVKFEDICLSKLESYLTAKSKNIKIETINTGMSAFNTADERDLLFNRGLQYQPDLVIVHFVLNDVEKDLFKPEPKIEFFRNYLSIYMKKDKLSNYSYLWSWMRQRFLRHVQGNTYIRACLESYLSDHSKFAFVRDALKDIKRLCRDYNAKLLVVIFPFYYNLNYKYPFQPIHDHVSTFCEKEGIPVLDLLPYYRAYSGPELWVHPVDQHPNEIAHAVAAMAIFNYLSDNKSFFNLDFLY